MMPIMHKMRRCLKVGISTKTLRPIINRTMPQHFMPSMHTVDITPRAEQVAVCAQLRLDMHAAHPDRMAPQISAYVRFEWPSSR